MQKFTTLLIFFFILILSCFVVSLESDCVRLTSRKHHPYFSDAITKRITKRRRNTLHQYHCPNNVDRCVIIVNGTNNTTHDDVMAMCEVLVEKLDFSTTELFHVFDYSCGLIRDILSKCTVGLQNRKIFPQKKHIFYSIETMLASDHISVADMIYSMLIRCYIHGIKPIVIGHSGASLEIEKALQNLQSHERSFCSIYVYGGASLLKKSDTTKIVNITTRKDFISPLYLANEKKVVSLENKYNIEIIDLPVQTVDFLYRHALNRKDVLNLFKKCGGWHSLERVYFWDILKKLQQELV